MAGKDNINYQDLAKELTRQKSYHSKDVDSILEAKFAKDAAKREEDLQKRVAEIQKKYRSEKRIAELKAEAERQKKQEDDAAKERFKLAKQMAFENRYRRSSLEEMKRLNKQRIENINNEIEALKIKAELEKDTSEETKNKIENLQKQSDRYHQLELEQLRREKEARYGNLSLEEKIAEINKRNTERQNKIDEAQNKYDLKVKLAEEESQDIYNKAIEDKKSEEEAAKERDEYKSKKEKEAAEDLGTDKNKIDAIYGKGPQTKLGKFLNNNPYGKQLGKLDGLNKISNLGEMVKGFSSLTKSVGGIKNLLAGGGGPLMILVDLVRKISKGIDEGIQKYVSLQTQYLAKVNTRLDTGNLQNAKNFDTITKGFAKAFGSSRYVSQASLVETLGKLAEAGIAYNLEQRTILATLSDRMVSTFDMLDDTLTRLTRLQQSDMSVASLGAESLITEFLNNTFQDTSYMSNVYDTVNSALLEATSQMTQKDAVSFTYNVQKWLGSLYSLGMSSEGISKLAQGVTYLATGNINAFNSDDALRTLFALSSNGSYSDLLVNGVNASNINTLLGNIVSYLADISTDTNQVTKQVKAGVFGGLSLSDIRSVANLTANDIEAIKNSTATWDTSISHVTDYLIDFASQNTSLAIQADNLVKNTVYDLGKNLVNNQAAYVGYVIGDTVGGLIGTALKTFAKLSNIGGTAIELVKSIGTGFSSLEASLTRASSFKLNNTNGGFLEKWLGWTGIGGQDTSYWDLTDTGLIKSRGSVYNGSSGVLNGISSSLATSYANYNDSALANTLYNQATTMEAGAVNYENGATALRDINDLYKALFEDQAAMRVILVSVEEQAQKDLTQQVYPTNDIDMDTVIDEVKDTRYAINGKLTDIYNRQYMSYSVGL